MQPFSEFLRDYIRDKYYEFMNDIQTEVNLFEWSDHYFKQKKLASRNTNSLLQKEVAHRFLITNTKVSSDKVIYTHVISNISPNISNTIDKSTNHVYKTYPCEVSDKLLIPKQQITDNIYSITKQTLMTINNTNQQNKINLIKKQMR